jgi:hypothetical protein
MTPMASHIVTFWDGRQKQQNYRNGYPHPQLRAFPRRRAEFNTAKHKVAHWDAAIEGIACRVDPAGWIDDLEGPRLFAVLPGSKVRCSLLSKALAFQLWGAVWFPNRYQFANLRVRCGPLDAPHHADLGDQQILPPNGCGGLPGDRRHRLVFRVTACHRQASLVEATKLGSCAVE